MSDFYGRHFILGSTYQSATDHLVFANLNTSRFMGLYGEVSGVNILTRADKRRILVDDDYSNFPLSIEIELLRDDGAPIPKNRQRNLESILFGTLSYRNMFIDPNDDPDGEYYEDIDRQGEIQRKRLYLRVRFVNPERIEYDCNVYGYKFTLETDSGMWWQETIGYHYYSGNYNEDTEISFTLQVNSDIYGYTYPSVAFYANHNGGDITWCNTDDSTTRLTTLVNVSASSLVHMDGRTNFVDENYYRRFQNMNFPRLKNGSNRIVVSGAIAEVDVDVINRRRF